MAVLWIIVTPNTANGYGFVIGIFVYGQLVVGGMYAYSFVPIAFLFFSPRLLLPFTTQTTNRKN
jgi:hypothetical protein